jgi:hypothetical protein
LGVAGVEETEGGEETGEAEVLVGAVGEVEAVVARDAGEAIEVGDVVEAGELIEYMEAGEVGGAVGEVKVVGIAAGARKSNIVKASAAAILAAIQPLSLPYSNVRGSSGLRPSLEIAFLQSRLGSARSNISVLSYSTIMPRSVTTPLM